MKHLLLLPFLLFILQGCSESTTEKAPESGNSSDTQVVDEPTTQTKVHFSIQHYGDGTDFEVKDVVVKAGATVREAMLAAQDELQFTDKEFKGGAHLIEGFRGVKSEDVDKHYWQYCVNGTYAAVGVDEQKIEDGMEISWHYAAYGETPCKKIGE
ncbi:MAG: DUF4430 domain-containing protein [Bacteroidota bacterium]